MAPQGSPRILVHTPVPQQESPQLALSKAHPKSFRFSRPLHCSRPRWSLSRDRVVSPAQPGTSPPPMNKPSTSVAGRPHTHSSSPTSPSLTPPGLLAFALVSDHPVPPPGQEQALLIPPETLLRRSSQGWLCPRVPSREKPSWVPPANVDPPLPRSSPIGHLVLFPSQYSLHPEMICVFI